MRGVRPSALPPAIAPTVCAGLRPRLPCPRAFAAQCWPHRETCSGFCRVWPVRGMGCARRNGCPCWFSRGRVTPLPARAIVRGNSPVTRGREYANCFDRWLWPSARSIRTGAQPRRSTDALASQYFTVSGCTPARRAKAGRDRFCAMRMRRKSAPVLAAPCCQKP